MSRTQVAVVALLGLMLASPARAGSWSLGAQLGAISLRSDEGGGTSTVVAFPLNALSYQPGLRLGFGDARHSREACLEGGLLVIDEAGTVVTIAVASLGYQHVFMQHAVSSPFASAWVGMVGEGGEGQYGNSISYGAGLGWRRVIRDEHGALRIEARYDYLRSGGAFERPKLSMLGLRLGFDLWL